MEEQRRKFLRTISTAAAFPALVSILNVNVEAQSKEGTANLDRGLSRDLRAQFPLLKERMNGHRLVYLDSAATTQRPRPVLDALSDFYLHDNANPSKSLHALAQRSASLYDSARTTVARFVNARRRDEIVWTRGTTKPSISLLRPGAEEILVPVMRSSRLFQTTTRIWFPGNWPRSAPTLLCTSGTSTM